LIWSDSQGASISSWPAEETAMNSTVLGYVVMMLYNLQQNPRGAILTMLLAARPQSSIFESDESRQLANGRRVNSARV
jgi:hypothetical protein